MSGASAAYHLRQNKAIERQLFVELLARLESGLPVKFSQYRYYGFGGAYMEDFRLAQRELGLTRMVSIEETANSLARQKFNRPVSCITFRKINSAVFVERYSSDRRAIVWLDYTRPEWKAQLNEATTLARALATDSVLKLTLPVLPSVLGDPPKDSEIDLHTYRLTQLEEMFGDLVPQGTVAADMGTKSFPRVMAGIVKKCMAGVFGAQSKYECLPLGIYSYSDGSPMLTVTMLIGRKDRNPRIWRKSRLGGWRFASKKWDDITLIDTPDLTLKERIFIEGLVPRLKPPAIHDRLGFHVADTRNESLQAVANYVDFHRQLPFFLKVMS